MGGGQGDQGGAQDVCGDQGHRQLECVLGVADHALEERGTQQHQCGSLRSPWRLCHPQRDEGSDLETEEDEDDGGVGLAQGRGAEIEAACSLITGVGCAAGDERVPRTRTTLSTPGRAAMTHPISRGPGARGRAAGRRRTSTRTVTAATMTMLTKKWTATISGASSRRTLRPPTSPYASTPTSAPAASGTAVRGRPRCRSTAMR